MAGVDVIQITGDSIAADMLSDVTNLDISAVLSPTITVSSGPVYAIYPEAKTLNHKADIIHELVIRNIDFEMYTAEDEVFTIIKWGKING